MVIFAGKQIDLHINAVHERVRHSHWCDVPHSEIFSMYVTDNDFITYVWIPEVSNIMLLKTCPQQMHIYTHVVCFCRYSLAVYMSVWLSVWYD